MIEVEDLTRYYGSVPAVRDASFSIGENEIVGFLGLNGAGKSTILKLLAGLLRPSAGTIKVAGIDAVAAPDQVRRRIGFLPEEPPLYREMQVAEFLVWVGQVKGCSAAEVHAALPGVLATCQLDDVAGKVINELSHGYRKRVGIAQAIIHKPDVVILDEPISGLDPRQIVDMRGVVQSLRERATVLISSHILSEVARTCDRVLVIHRGRIVAEGSEEQLGASLGSGGRLTFVLNGRIPAIEEFLAKSELVASYEVGQAEHSEHAQAHVTLAGEVREDLVKEFVSAGFGVRAMEDSVSELERIFLELTRQGATPDALASQGVPHVEKQLEKQPKEQQGASA